MIMNYKGGVGFGEVDKATGTSVTELTVPDLAPFGLSPVGFAFAHRGGHFWFFTSLNFEATKVYDFDPVASTTTLVKSDGPRGVVGAGVSTCAPLATPK